jgi:hypothetical protein
LINPDEVLKIDGMDPDDKCLWSYQSETSRIILLRCYASKRWTNILFRIVENEMLMNGVDETFMLDGIRGEISSGCFLMGDPER